MKILKTLTIILLVIFHCDSARFRVNNFGMSKCYAKPQLVELNNINLITDVTGNILVSGSMSANVNIESPIKAVVAIKKRVFGLWVPIGCINNVGSCTYGDICKYGINEDNSCPTQLKENDVPCRCPISKGNYTIPQKMFLNPEQVKWNVIKGKYSGRIVVRHLSQELGCYNVKFTLY